MATHAMVNGETPKDNCPAVNFILGGENESENVVGESPDEYVAADEEGSEEKMDSFPSGLDASQRNDSNSNNSLGNMFGLVERRKRLR